MLGTYAALTIDMNLFIRIYARIAAIVSLLSYICYSWYFACGCEGTDRYGFCDIQSGN